MTGVARLRDFVLGLRRLFDPSPGLAARPGGNGTHPFRAT